MNPKNPHQGGSFDDFLRADGIFDEVNAAAIKKTFAIRLEKQMTKRHLTKSALAGRLGTSRAALDRVLNGQNTSVTLHTLSRTAAAVGCKLKIELIPA